HFVWLLTFIPGKVLAEVRPHTNELLHSVGRLLGEIDGALQSFCHPAATRELKWDSARAQWIRGYLDQVKDLARRATVERVLQHYESVVLPLVPQLRKSVIYGDGNDYNVLVNTAMAESREAVSVIDFGDMHHGLVVSEPAIAAAYAMLGKSDPLAAAAAVVRRFHRLRPLKELELLIRFPLIERPLPVSGVNPACRKAQLPGDPSVTVSEAGAWEALDRLARINPRFAHYTFRKACGLPAMPQATEFLQWLSTCGKSAAPVLDLDLRTEPCHVFDLSVSSTFLGADPQNAATPALTTAIEQGLKRVNAAVGVGRDDEARPFYYCPPFV